MYENLSEKRKQELDTLREWAVCAGDDYYFSMDQSDFEKSMKDCENEEFFKVVSTIFSRCSIKRNVSLRR